MADGVYAYAYSSAFSLDTSTSNTRVVGVISIVKLMVVHVSKSKPAVTSIYEVVIE